MATMGARPEHLLMREITQTLIRHWALQREPVAISVLSRLYRRKSHRLLGPEWDISTLCGFLERAGVVTIRSARTGKQWVFLRETWESFSTHQRKRWNARVERLRDPYDDVHRINRREAVRSLVAEALESLTKKSTVTESSTDGGTSGNP